MHTRTCIHPKGARTQTLFSLYSTASSSLLFGIHPSLGSFSDFSSLFFPVIDTVILMGSVSIMEISSRPLLSSDGPPWTLLFYSFASVLEWKGKEDKKETFHFFPSLWPVFPFAKKRDRREREQEKAKLGKALRKTHAYTDNLYSLELICSNYSFKFTHAHSPAHINIPHTPVYYIGKHILLHYTWAYVSSYERIRLYVRVRINVAWYVVTYFHTACTRTHQVD